MTRIVYYKKDIALKSQLLLWSLFSSIIFFLACTILGAILNSHVLGIITGIVFVSLYLYKESSQIHSIEFSDRGVKLEYLRPFAKKNIDIPFCDILCVYFYCGPFALNTAGLYVIFKRGNKLQKIGVSESQSSSIEKLFKILKQMNIKCGVSKDSVDYLGFKKMFGTIDI